MATPSRVLAFCVAGLLCSIALAAAPTETLKITDLAGHPERWPDKVTIKRDLNFGGGASLKSGQQVSIIQFDGAAIGVDAGNNQLFEVEAQDTDMLDAANAAWSKLTPEQRAIDARVVMADPSLWPDKVKSMDGFRLNSGKDVQPGEEFEMMTIEGNNVVLWLTADKAKLTSDMAKTDLVKRARERAGIAPDKRPSRVAAALKGNLVDAD